MAENGIVILLLDIKIIYTNKNICLCMCYCHRIKYSYMKLTRLSDYIQ